MRNSLFACLAVALLALPLAGCGDDATKGAEAACSCDKGKAGETVWCEACNAGYVKGEKTKCEACFKAKTGDGPACEACAAKDKPEPDEPEDEPDEDDEK